MPTQTMNAASGTYGRVQTHAGLVVAGISSWRRQSKSNPIPIPHFESPTNSIGLMQPNQLRGMGETTVAFEGIVNLTAGGTGGTHTVMENGMYVALDLLVVRPASPDAGVGYPNVVGWVTDFQLGTKVSNEAATFSATLAVDGVFPAFGTVS